MEKVEAAIEWIYARRLHRLPDGRQKEMGGI